MHLALGRPRADRAPGDQVREVLRRDHVEVFGAGRQVELVDLEQDAAREAQAFVDAVAVVEMRIVDEPLPADGRARLLEIDAHHDDEIGGELALQRPRGASRSRSPRRSRGSSRARRRPAADRRRRAARDGSPAALRNVVVAARSDAGNSRSRCDGGASSVISRIRVSSIGQRGRRRRRGGGRLRWAVDVGTVELRQRFLSKNMILRTAGWCSLHCATPHVALH